MRRKLKEAATFTKQTGRQSGDKQLKLVLIIKEVDDKEECLKNKTKGKIIYIEQETEKKRDNFPKTISRSIYLHPITFCTKKAAKVMK